MTDESGQQESWYFDENIPGSGQRPEYLESKYRTVADQAKAYKEARKALGALSGAPESYDVDNFRDSINLESPAIKSFMEYSKNNRLNQDAVNSFLSTIKDYEQSFVPNLADELSRLDGGEQRHGVVEQWAKNNLSQAAFEVFNDIPKTAETIAFFDEIRQKEAQSRSTGGAGLATAQQKPVTLSDVKAELSANYKRYTSDPIYRQSIENRMALAMGD